METRNRKKTELLNNEIKYEAQIYWCIFVVTFFAILIFISKTNLNSDSRDTQYLRLPATVFLDLQMANQSVAASPLNPTLHVDTELEDHNQPKNKGGS